MPEARAPGVVGGDRQARSLADGGGQIQNMEDKGLTGKAVRDVPGPTHDQRDAHDVFVHDIMFVDKTMPAGIVAVIAAIDDQRMLGQPQLVEGVEHQADGIVDLADHPQIAGHVM